MRFTDLRLGETVLVLVLAFAALETGLAFEKMMNIDAGTDLTPVFVASVGALAMVGSLLMILGLLWSDGPRRLAESRVAD